MNLTRKGKRAAFMASLAFYSIAVLAVGSQVELLLPEPLPLPGTLVVICACAVLSTLLFGLSFFTEQREAA